MNVLTKMLSSVVQSSAKSLLGEGIKKSVKGLIKQHTQKSPQTIEQEIVSQLGYLTSHYKLDKDQRISYRPSIVFMHEWLTCSPSMKNRIVKDEENGQVYLDEQPLSNQSRVKIIHDFIKATGAQSQSLSYHLDGALKLIDASDINAAKFKAHFKGWKEGSPSVIDGFLEGCFGSGFTDDPAHANLVFRKWIIGTARRAISAGSVLDGCLIFQGETGLGKTSFLRQLLPAPFEKRTGEIHANIKSSDKLVEALLGKTVASFDELSVLEHANTMETFKSLLTSQFTDVRLAWAKQVRRFLMRCGLAATTNKQKFLPDPALSRRMWVIKLIGSQRLNFDYLNANKTALWQEAVSLAESGHTCIMSMEEQKQIETYNQKFMLP